MPSTVTLYRDCKPVPPWALRALTMAVVIALMAVGLSLADSALAATVPSQPKPEDTPELTAEGKVIYFRRCSFCHGLLGDGEGPAAAYLDPRPRDFTLGTFKFRSTESGELPTDEDLFATISRGLAGTGMQSFDDQLIKNGLSEHQRWAVISYVKTFAIEFSNDEFDPYKKLVELPSDLPPYDEDSIAKGKEIFERAKCWECHGKQGRGDGQKSFDRTDDWGFPIRIRNVTHSWKIKTGAAVEDIYMRFSTGINGTPMPSFAKALNVEERWYLANFIKSLQHQRTEHRVLKALPTGLDVPDAPDDPLWASAEPMDIIMTGQVIAAPRWQNPSIDLVTLRAIFDDNEIAFLIEWDDPFQDIDHREDIEFETRDIRKVGTFSSYVEANGMVPRKLKTFRDSVALQFPAKATQGTRKPHFFRGTASNPVNLWIWKADLEAAGQRSVDDAIARGWGQPPRSQNDDQQQVGARAAWQQGRWRVVLKRTLATEDRNDVQFVQSKFIPMAINAWDGSNGEHGMIMSLSSWYYVFLEAPKPWSVYLYTILGVLLSAMFGLWMVKKAEAEGARDDPIHTETKPEAKTAEEETKS